MTKEQILEYINNEIKRTNEAVKRVKESYPRSEYRDLMQGILEEIKNCYKSTTMVIELIEP